MISLVVFVLYVGYLLVYAAVAAGGALADRPWEAVRVDAYSVKRSGGGGRGGGILGGWIGRIWGWIPKIGGIPLP